MKKNLLILLGILMVFPSTAFCFCFDYVSFHSTNVDNCTVQLNWEFEECGEPGIYYIEYSTDGSNFSIISTITAAGAPGNASYTYTDSYAQPAANPTGNIFYRIMFVSPNVVSPHFSPVVENAMGSSPCSMNNVTRCSDNNVPTNLSITGPATICNGVQATYSLSSPYTTVWIVQPTNSPVTISGGFLGTPITLANNVDGALVTLSTNILGCRTVTKQIELGVLPSFSYSLSPTSSPFCTNIRGNTVLLNPTSYPYADLSFEWGYVNVNITPVHTVVVNTHGTTEQDFTFPTTGTYQIYARARNSCGYFQGSIATINMPVTRCTAKQTQEGSTAKGFGTEKSLEEPDNVLSVFPNPATDIVNVRLPDSLNLNHLSVRLLDLTGRVIQRIIPLSYQVPLKLGGLAGGMYILEIDNGTQPMIRKIIKR